MSNLLKKAWNQAKTVEPSVGNRFPEGKDIKCQLISLKMKPKQDNPENIDVSLSYRTLADTDKELRLGQSILKFTSVTTERLVSTNSKVKRMLIVLWLLLNLPDSKWMMTLRLKKFKR